MDFIVKLLKSRDPLIGIFYNSIIVIVDRITKYAYFRPCKEKTIAESISREIL